MNVVDHGSRRVGYKAIVVGSLHEVECRTKNISIHGCAESEAENRSSYYGTDYKEIQQLIKRSPELGKPLVDDHLHTEAEVVWATRNEMARTVEDVLARRLRLLFLDAKAAMVAAPRVAELMAMELGHDEAWEKRQVQEFSLLAGNYILVPNSNRSNEKTAAFSKQIV